MALYESQQGVIAYGPAIYRIWPKLTESDPALTESDPTMNLTPNQHLILTVIKKRYTE